jgi:uncharacterized damage-inducible protein DinB
MFLTINDFVSSWTHESTATQRVLNALTETSLQQQIAPNHRKLGQLRITNSASITMDRC